MPHRWGIHHWCKILRVTGGWLVHTHSLQPFFSPCVCVCCCLCTPMFLWINVPSPWDFWCILWVLKRCVFCACFYMRVNCVFGPWLHVLVAFRTSHSCTTVYVFVMHLYCACVRFCVAYLRECMFARTPVHSPVCMCVCTYVCVCVFIKERSEAEGGMTCMCPAC